MNRTAKLPLLLCFALVTVACGGRSESLPRTAEKVDPERFMGMWYEIARLPFAPERDCAAFASRYERVNDEEFGIVNYCWHKSANGPMRKTRAEAYLDTDAAAELKIQLNWPVWFDLWILYISDDYQHAVLGTPNRKYLWLMSRTPQVSDAVRADLVARATRKGFDTAGLIFSDAAQPVGTDEPKTEP